MPSSVLVEFESDAKAVAFVERINGTYGLPMPKSQEKGIIVTGVWKRPTKFCECDNTSRMKMMAYARSKRYGWWVHVACRRPSKVWIQAAERLWLALGKNLLPGAPTGEPADARAHDNAALPPALRSVGAVVEDDTRTRKRRERPRRNNGSD